MPIVVSINKIKRTPTVTIIERGGGLSTTNITMSSSTRGTPMVSSLLDVVYTESITNNSTLVYNSTINKYEIKELNIDGGEF